MREPTQRTLEPLLGGLQEIMRQRLREAGEAVATDSDHRERVYIGLGANLPSGAGRPVETLEKAVEDIAAIPGVRILRRSPWYESAPVPPDPSQPWFVNGILELATALLPAALLAELQRLEAESGRVRSVANAARPLDLDIVAYGDRVVSQGAPLLPHPRMHERAFVLLPLQAIAPHWRHPITGESIADLVAGLPADQEIRLL